jgi:hypothetical protein
LIAYIESQLGVVLSLGVGNASAAPQQAANHVTRRAPKRQRQSAANRRAKLRVFRQQVLGRGLVEPREGIGCGGGREAGYFGGSVKAAGSSRRKVAGELAFEPSVNGK